MLKKIGACLTIVSVLLFASPAFAEDMGTPDQAKAMCEKAAAFVKSSGKDKAVAAFNDPSNKEWHDRDLYVFAVDDAGVFVAHGAKPALIGRNMIDMKDVEGNPLVRMFVAVSDRAWVDYKWPNPLTKAVQDKTSYIINESGLRVGVGAYRSK